MIKHFIIMSSSYTDGIRIAFDITGNDLSIKEKAEQIISLIKQKCGDDVPLSTHFLETADCSWESVEMYDPFFENVKCIQSIDVFIETIKKNRTLSGLDVANYILSKVKCTHLSLEKLVYFAYADYLCDFQNAFLRMRFTLFLMALSFPEYITFIKEAVMIRWSHS